jgi:hypothetical protein
MQFNSETNGLDLYSDCRYLCGLDETSDTTSYPIKAFTRNANFALDRLNALALKVGGTWTFDDSNQSGELLDVTNNVVSGTQKTALGASWLIISRVRVKDSAGNWVTLPELPRRQQSDAQLNATSGQPTSFFVLGNYLYFDKTPNYNSTGGLEVQFQRGASYFNYNDTTKTPGFAVQFHRLVSMMAAQDFCQINDLETRANSLALMIGTPPDVMNGEAGSGMLKEYVDFYSRRDDDAKVALIAQREDYGQMGLAPSASTYPSNVNPRGF